MEFKREHTLLHKLFIIDGTGKCGKSLMLDILSCFQGVEKQDYNSFIEFVPLAYKHNKISSDIAKAILQTEMDTELYNNMVGRYVNSRLSDDTSLYKYHSPSKYLKRSLEEDGPIIYDKVLIEQPIYTCWTHDLINKSDIVFEAFGNKLVWLFLNRRPIDIVYEWGKQKYSERMAQDPTEMQYNVKYKDTTVPEIALGWEEEFLYISPLERTVKMIYTYFKLNRDSLQEKQHYQNLYIFNFENLVTCPYKEIEKLKKITNRELLPVINQILAKAKCPRKLNTNEFLERETSIIKNISPFYAQLIPEMVSMYDDINRFSEAKNAFLEAVD